MDRAGAGEWVAVGQVASCHGLAGAVKVRLLTDYPERFFDLEKVLVDSPARESPLLCAVESAAPLGRLWTVKLAGVDSREAAAALAGSLLLVPSRERAALPAGSYYVDQIIGLAVQDEAGKPLGRVAEVLSTGGHDLYVVRPGQVQAGEPGRGGQPAGSGYAESRPREWLLPAVKDMVIEINLNGGVMVVRLPEGLTEL